MNFLPESIIALDPEAQVTVGSTFESIVWHNGNRLNITKDQVIQKIAELEAESPMRRLREERGELIAATDWRATVDYPGSDQAAWLTYRQALRDLPANSTPSLDDNGQLTGVTWPTPPE